MSNSLASAERSAKAVRSKAQSSLPAILRAAEELFLEKPYADVSMRQLADRAGVTTGALYHYFPGKAQLYYEMLRRDFSHKEVLLREAVEAQASARKNLENLLMAFVTLPSHKRDLMHLVRRDVNTFQDPLRRRIIDLYQRSLPNLVEEVISEGMRNGELELGEARVVAWELIALLEVALHPRGVALLGGERAVVDQVMGIFWSGASKRAQ